MHHIQNIEVTTLAIEIIAPWRVFNNFQLFLLTFAVPIADHWIRNIAALHYEKKLYGEDCSADC
jgi:hypothetical protein